MGGTTVVQDGPSLAPPPDTTAVPGSAPGSPTEPGPRRVRLALLGLLPALLLAALGQTTVATALPEIAGELHGPDRMSWTVTAHLLTSTAVLPVYGRLGDSLGRKGVFRFAVVLFVVGSALAALAQTMDQLIAFRAVQGAGAGGLVIGVQTIVADVVPPRRRGRYMGPVGAAFALAAVAGPLLGGYVTDHLSWRWCFYANVPFGLLALAAVVLVPKRPGPTPVPRFDVLGALLMTAASTCLILLTRWGGTEHAWGSRPVLGLGAGALAATVLFLVVERFAAQPLVPLRLFKDSVFNVTALLGLVVGVCLSGAAGHLPAFLRLVGGASAAESGLLMLSMTGGIAVASVVSGQLISRTGKHRVLTVLGGTLCAAGTWLLSRLDADTPRLHCGLWMSVLGAGIGTVIPVLIVAAQNCARPADLGAATGAHTYVRQIGGSVGAAVFGTLFADRLAGALRDHGPARGTPAGPESITPQLVHALPPALRDGWIRAYAEAVPRVFLCLVPVLVLGLLIAFFLKETPLHTAASPHSAPAPEPATAPPGGPGIPRARPPHSGGIPVCGTVQHPDGTAVPRAALTLIDVSGRQVGRGASGDDGRYALATPGSGAYVLIAAAGGHQPQAVSVTVGERPVELDVVLGGAGRLTGSVVTADGTPVRNASVTLTNVRGEVVASTSSGREGGYVIGDLVAGEYTLAASAPAFRPAAQPVSVQAARETRQDVELAGGAVLRGTVHATAGRAVEDARVTLLDAAGNVVDTLRTGPDGMFRFVDLSSGDYTVIAAGYPPVAAVLQVAGGGRTERDLQLGHED